jgi:hypothetical protein
VAKKIERWPGWMGLTTVPRDGTEFWGCMRNGDAKVLLWNEDCGSSGLIFTDKEGGHWMPTHWMPIIKPYPEGIQAEPEPFLELAKRAYGWMVAVDGVVYGLVAGDMGYDPSDVTFDEVLGVAWNAEHKEQLDIPLDGNGLRPWPLQKAWDALWEQLIKYYQMGEKE